MRPFLAAILTVVGYSMNESVVIFDRVRENTHTHKRSDTFADLGECVYYTKYSP